MKTQVMSQSVVHNRVAGQQGLLGLEREKKVKRRFDDKRSLAQDIYNAASSEISYDSADGNKDLRDEDKSFLRLDGMSLGEKIEKNFLPTGENTAESTEETVHESNKKVSTSMIYMQKREKERKSKKWRYKADEDSETMMRYLDSDNVQL